MILGPVDDPGPWGAKTQPRNESGRCQLGRQDARDLAVALFAGIQGAALLANTFRDPSLLIRQTGHLERWIDSLAA